MDHSHLLAVLSASDFAYYSKDALGGCLDDQAQIL